MNQRVVVANELAQDRGELAPNRNHAPSRDSQGSVHAHTTDMPSFDSTLLISDMVPNFPPGAKAPPRVAPQSSPSAVGAVASSTSYPESPGSAKTLPPPKSSTWFIRNAFGPPGDQ